MLDRTKHPQLSQFEDFSFSIPAPRKLKNGIEVYVINSGDQQVNKAEIIFRGGIFEQKKPLQAMMTVSMLMHGCKGKSSAEISEFFDFYGSIVNTKYIDNYTSLSILSLNEKMEEVLPVVHDILYCPTFPEKEFKLLHAQIKGAYANVRKRVRYISQVAATKLLLGENHPVAYDVTDEDIDAISIEDLKDFHNTYYRPENCIIVLSGKVDERLFNLVDLTFGNDPINGAPSDLTSHEICPSERHFEVKDKDDAMQSSVVFLQNSIMRGDSDYIKLRIAITALGGYFGSRLMKNIREEKGYTYSIGASLCATRNTSYINISSECDTAYTEALIEEVKKEILTLSTEPMDSAELDTLKNCMLSELVKILDTPISMSSIITSNLFYATGDDYFNSQREAIMNITAVEIRDIAKKYLNIDNFYIVVAGNEKLMKLEHI